MAKNLKPENNTPVVLHLKCGSCIFFKAIKNEKFDDVCSKLGVVAQCTPCKQYKTDARAFSLKGSKGENLAKAIIPFSNKDLEVIASAVNQERQTRKAGFRLGQKVYVRIYPGEYLSNYMVATVLQADKDSVYVEGASMKVRAILQKSSVFTKEQWEHKLKGIVRRCAYLDPDLRSHVRPKFKEPLEEIPESFAEQAKKQARESKTLEVVKREKINSRQADLTDVFTIRG